MICKLHANAKGSHCDHYGDIGVGLDFAVRTLCSPCHPQSHKLAASLCSRQITASSTWTSLPAAPLPRLPCLGGLHGLDEDLLRIGHGDGETQGGELGALPVDAISTEKTVLQKSCSFVILQCQLADEAVDEDMDGHVVLQRLLNHLRLGLEWHRRLMAMGALKESSLHPTHPRLLTVPSARHRLMKQKLKVIADAKKS